MEAVRAEGFAQPASRSRPREAAACPEHAEGSKYERRFTNFSRSHSPFDRLRACPVPDTGANVSRPCMKIVNRA